MPTYTPRKAERVQLKLRLALAGPIRSGKTFSVLLFAGAMGGRCCVIDSDQGSAQKYLGEPGIPEFDTIVLESYTPEDYIAAIEAAKDYDVLVIDTISPEWLATLEIKDEVTANSPSQNAYTVGWRVATPRHQKFVQTMLAFPGHLLVTIQERVKYTLEADGAGQLAPRRPRMEPIQREDLNGYFDILCEMHPTNVTMTVQSRCREVHGMSVRKPTPDFMIPIQVWLGTGRRVYTLKEIGEAVRAAGLGEAELKSQMLAVAPGITSYGQLSARQREDLYLYFTALATLPAPETATNPAPVGVETIANGQPT